MEDQARRSHQEGSDQVRTLIAGGAYPQALLISGARGLGKLDLARSLAKAILCEGQRPPCGTCRSCRLMEGQGDHPDYTELGSQARGSRASISKALISEIIQDSSLASYYGQARVYVINDFDLVTPQGQNALLKTLEEPREGVYFILVTSNPAEVLGTVLSRCQRLEIRPLAPEDLAQALEETGLEPEVARLVASFSGGSLARALVYAQDPQGFRRRKTLLELLDKLVMGGSIGIFDLEDFFAEEADQEEDLFYLMESWARDLAVYYETGEASLIGNQDISDQVIRQVKSLGPRSGTIFDRVLAARDQVRKNVNRGLALEGLFIYIGG